MQTSTRKSRLLVPVLRFLLSLLLFLLSLLCIFKAPTNELWLAAILVTEFGHWFALLSLLLLLAGLGPLKFTRAELLLLLIAAVLYITPLLRAIPVAMELPEQLTAAFGEFHNPSAAPTYGRSAPIVFWDLFRGVPRPKVEPETIVYATPDSTELSLDFYRPPAGSGPFPCVVVVHGGAWQTGTSRQLHELNAYLAGRGYAVAAINYRLAPRWQYPAQLQDVRAAIDFLKTQSRVLRLAPQRLVLLGRSAGAHLALLAGYTANDPAIRGVVSYYGPADLLYGWNHPANPHVIDTRKVLTEFLGGSPEQVPQNYDEGSPIHFVTPLTPPTLLIHGGRDELVSPEQSRRLAARLEEMRVRYVFLFLPYATHGCDFKMAGPSGQMSTYALERFLTAILQ
ncbi:MAG: alpha/beta hydrolase [Calditrichaeota bacterium]|nr:MAG: alpha/beta hydrolase [Calditrichota bacterium]